MTPPTKLPFAATDYELKKLFVEAMSSGAGLPRLRPNKPASDRKSLRSNTSSVRRVIQRKTTDKIIKTETVHKLWLNFQSSAIPTMPPVAPKDVGELRESQGNSATLGIILKKIANISAKMDQLNVEVQQIKKALSNSDNEPSKANAYQDLNKGYSMLKTPLKVVIPGTPCGVLRKRLKGQVKNFKF